MAVPATGQINHYMHLEETILSHARIVHPGPSGFLKLITFRSDADIFKVAVVVLTRSTPAEGVILCRSARATSPIGAMLDLQFQLQRHVNTLLGSWPVRTGFRVSACGPQTLVRSGRSAESPSSTDREVRGVGCADEVDGGARRGYGGQRHQAIGRLSHTGPESESNEALPDPQDSSHGLDVLPPRTSPHSHLPSSQPAISNPPANSTHSNVQNGPTNCNRASYTRNFNNSPSSIDHSRTSTQGSHLGVHDVSPGRQLTHSPAVLEGDKHVNLRSSASFRRLVERREGF
ncbi:hypothetical protein BDV95DRAFT_108643 [Massariosphaeria phaeospora]|uniref:Uncharacterized protein n=1 Tax=Massariosphaeria phaeospora TaxID=100035 RepID=A0A7C8IA62_9PLEO|nr:hypothetical protein BDV95DRAFT_108643 [Massariosphaeria phaeospora]